MNEKIRLKGQLKSYMRWPLLLTILLVLMNIWIYVIDLRAGALMTAFVIVYVLVVFVLYIYNKPLIVNELISFATQYGQVQKKLLKELAIPYALLDEKGKVIWMNHAFSEVTERERTYRRSVTNIFSEITQQQLPAQDEMKTMHVHLEERDFRADLKYVGMEEMAESNTLVDAPDYEGYLVALYLYDETEINRYIQENEEQRLVCGLIYIDNFEEALESVEEVRRSLLIALVDRRVNKYFSGYDGLVKKLEKDKYFVVFKHKYVAQLQENKFDLLDEVKTVNIGNEMAITLSIGLGMDGDSYNKNYEYARIAIDLALGRGGDQAVVKKGEKLEYYGGKTKQVEKSTRVKARVKAHALREVMESKDKVVIMGHQITDVDSFGAAVGIYRAARVLNKRAYIVINEVTTSIRPMMEGFIVNPTEYEEDMFIPGERAEELVDNNTVLVVVDTNKPSFTECPRLLNMTKTIAVLDHHRQGAEVISNAILSYIEPYASSTCEMVAEILQYFEEGIKIKNLEADCIYAGIIIDTNNFMSKTGVRTFEAAAFLRRCGADVTRVRKLFRNDMGAYKARAEAVRHSQVYRDAFAIAVCPNENIESPTIVGAQAANELLNIIGIKASFVLTEYNNKIYLSARSIDEVNVQLIMERLGGGGHMNIAGAQLTGYTMEQAIEYLKNTLDQMIEEGAL
ncbi:DHH family phosphoesterase [Diplocloster agilis]|uniref:Cyclic-di-AMP phosphodiesterase n=1 Tax=Diplocloster agilis TaxID=2850323 RepID=A0A949JZR5_9FIRM|nr:MULTISPECIES: DHH family phosphoesterase [Lachnospiraceae]MBU9736692.1 DHH family phosphoesterase [Diplocloster agilis]MBU9743511.1 DHH family phosphoesterase [Diplocloster agilis]MCU6734846.1 DHH family phosphoesterase [Suonthocola fibrivorans]SCJ56219.1 Bifunctional oligoribonuclease and PAP phosphatase nrnA [uncultured Clostridium sp.]